MLFYLLSYILKAFWLNDRPSFTSPATQKRQEQSTRSAVQK